MTHACNPNDPDHYCYNATSYNLSSLPINCTDGSHLNIQLTCFRITFDPILAVAVAGGVLKAIPAIIFSTITYAYVRLRKTVHKISSQSKVAHIGSIVIAEFILIGGGIGALVSVVKVNSLNSILFATVNPVDEIKHTFAVSMYFLVACFVWCLHPQTSSSIRYHGSQWKKEITRKKNLQNRKQEQRKQEIAAQKQKRLHEAEELLNIKTKDS